MSTTDGGQPSAVETVELVPSGAAADALTSLHAGVASRAGTATIASLADEVDVLRRTRLLGAAIFLAATFGLLTVWVFASDNPATLTASGSRFSLRVGLLALRCLLAAGVAGLLASRLTLDRRSLRAVEWVLFLGLTLVLVTSQYFVGIELARRGPSYVSMILAFQKDGVIQLMAMMMIYGMLIPNRPSVAWRLVAAMFLVPIAAVFLLGRHPEVVEAFQRLGEAEEAGSNLLFLAVGAVLAVYGAFLVNGLRVQLHKARKFGQYQLVRKLGEGGMGEVYLAEHQLLKRPCALKLIRAEAGTNPLALARFEREVQSAARLAHPNSIEIYDYGHTEDGTFYYVMEYLQGLSLADLVRQTGPLPPGRIIYLFRQACAGLAEAHDLGLVHRDLKPANLFVAVRGGESDVAKVLDFGLVKLTKDPGAEALTTDMTVSGTPQYMAPEQAVADRTLDARADIYALGAMMYAALTGRPPFTGASAMAIMIAQARDPVVPPSQLVPGAPEDLEHVILRCLAKKPADRFPTVGALSAALAACESASQWGPNRADAWWAAHIQAGLQDAPRQPEAEGRTTAVLV
jgi:serine/threonine-protein kinase